MLMTDDATGRSSYHRRGAAGGRSLHHGRGSGDTGGRNHRRRGSSMVVVVVLRTETGRRRGLTALFGFQHPQLRFGTLQFDGFLLELK